MPRSRAGSSSSPASRRASASPVAAGLMPGIGPKTAERLERAGHHDARRSWPRAPTSRSPPRSARATAAACSAARGSRTTARSPSERERGLGVARDDVRRRHRRPRPSWRRCCAAGRAAVRAAWRARSAAGGRSRSRCASTTSRPSPGPARSPSRDERRRGRPGVAVELLRRVRARRGRCGCSGVRVGGVRGGEPAEAPSRSSRWSWSQPAGPSRAALASRRRESRASGLLDAELVEHPDDDAAQVVLAAVGATAIASIRRSSAAPRGRRRRARAKRVVESTPDRVLERRSAPRGPSAAKRRGRRRASSSASSRVAAGEQDARERHGGVGRPGSSSTARRSDASSPACDEPVGLGRQEPVEEAARPRGRLGADELVDDPAVLERLDGRDALDAERLRRSRGLASVSSLASTTLPSRAAAAFSSSGPELRGTGRTTPAQKSTTTGTVARALEDLGLEVLLGDIDRWAMALRVGLRRWRRSTVDRGGVTLPATTPARGPGRPAARAHGDPPLRRHGVQGARARRTPRARLRRARPRRARAAPAPGRVRLRRTWPTTSRRCSTTRGIERAVLAGASMGAHTLAARWRCARPDRVARPGDHHPGVTSRDATRSGLAALGRASPTGLRSGGIEGFVAAYGEPRRARALARHGAEGDPPAPGAARASRRASPTRCERCRARGRSASLDDLARDRVSRPSWSPAATRPTPSIPSASASAGPRRSATRSCARRSPGSRRSPGRAASSPSSSPISRGSVRPSA